MKKIAATFAIILLATTLYAQSYNMSNTPVSTCGGTFYDSGGSGGNYGNNQNFTKTFCATSAGDILSFNFTSFRTNDAGDILYIYDGPTTASPLIGALTGNLGGFGTINSSGQCMTFRFVSNAAGVRLGWAASISCTTMLPCNYMLTLSDAGCNGTGAAMFDVYFNGAYAGSVWPDPFCRFNILLIGLVNGDNITVNYAYDGNPAYDTQNSFQLYSPTGSVIASGSIPAGSGTVNVINVNTSCSLLPIELAEFAAQCEDDGVLVKWKTYSEYNSSHFTLDRSEDLSEWTAVTTLPGAGNSHDIKKYEYYDTYGSTRDMRYYKLVQIDFDGASETFGPISIGCIGEYPGMLVVPNPFEDVLKVMVTNTESEELRIIIYDMLGSEVYSHTCAIGSDSYEYNIQTGFMKPGPYIITMSCGGTFQTFKNVKK